MEFTKSVLKRVVAGAGIFILASAIIISCLPNVAFASNPKPYCKNPNQQNCLRPIVVAVSHECQGHNAIFHFSFNNPNSETAPRNITMYFNGNEFFEDSGFAEPGISTLTFGPLDPGSWQAVVWWDDITFAVHPIEHPINCPH